MASQRRPVLLTVDDHRLVHEFYAVAFARDYDHLRAYGGREALKIVRSRTVDVMVLDLVMPDLHGLEVLDRALTLNPDLVVVISSVVDTAQHALRAIRRGAVDYFLKPTDPEVMEMVVRQLLARRDDPTIAISKPALVTRRVLVVGPDPAFRAALAVALQPSCRVDVAARSSVAIVKLGTMLPDLIVLDLRSPSVSHMLGLQSLRARFPEGPMIVVGPVDRVGRLLQSSTGQPEILVPEPVDFALLFHEIATLLPPDPDSAPSRTLSPSSSAAVSCVMARCGDHSLRVEHLSAGTRLSVDHFAHVFSAEMAIPPMQYVVRVRVEAAIYMLRETTEKVSAIARQFGFYDGPHLAMTLRRRGLGRPSDFRPQPSPGFSQKHPSVSS